MKTIDRLTMKSYLGPMVLSFFIVMFVLMMNFMWRYIDELVGKGLGMGVIMELLMYAAATMIPMGLPLATLFGAIMTMGNLGENYELLAMKSAGMSLLRILRPLLIVVGLISIGSFFVANNLVPYSARQMSALLYDIRNQKQEIEFKDGIFFTDVDNMSIRVDRQVGADNKLFNVILYDNRNANMSITTAESGYIRMSDDKRFLLVTLYDGEMYQMTRNNDWYDKSAMERNRFTEQNSVIELEGFDFSRSDTGLFDGPKMMNVAQLNHGIDSLDVVVATTSVSTYENLFTEYLFPRDHSIVYDSLRAYNPRMHPALLRDSIDLLNVREKQKLWQDALIAAQNSRGTLTYGGASGGGETAAKHAVANLYSYQISLHQKISLPFSIMIFFLIGAALGAIIRKGGLGMPVVVSVLFFVVYYIISLMGEKMAKEGTLTAFQGIWLSTFVLLPIAVFLLYKATNDSNLFNAEWYMYRYREAKAFFRKIFKKQKHNNGTIEQQGA